MKKLNIFFIIAIFSIVSIGCGGKSRLKLGETDEGEVVEAVGLAPHDTSDLLATKRASLTNAQRNAVEKVVGVFVSAKALNEQAIQIENNILAQTEGYIKKYDIMSEGPEGEFYKTKIRALVSLRNLEADLKKMSLLDKPKLQRPRVHVVLTEHIDKAAIKERPAATALEQALIDQGYVIIGKDRAEEAELEVQGKVTAYPFQSEGLGGFVSYRARLDAKVIQVGTKDILVSHGREASGLGGNKDLAGLKALETVGSLVGDELGEKVEEVWVRNRNLLIFVENVETFDQVDRIKKHIGAQPGVDDLTLRMYDEGMAQFEVQLGNLQSTELATRIQKSKTLKMTVLETQPQTLRLKLN